MHYEVGTWTGANDSTFMASAKIVPGDFGKWVHLAGVFDGQCWCLYRNGLALSPISRSHFFCTACVPAIASGRI